MQDIIHWKYPALSFAVLVGYWAAVLTFQPFMITMSLIPLLIMGKVAPGLFIKHEGAAKKGKVKQEKPKDEKQGALEQTKNLHKMAIDVQKILDFIVGLLEKGFHTFIWIRPQATFTLCIALSLSKLIELRLKTRTAQVRRTLALIFISVTVVLYHIPIRYLLLAWGTKKLSIYGIKPNYKDNNELLGKFF